MGNFSDLPAEIMLDIFIRLPAESVLDCKIVSKTWKNVIHRPFFAQMHTNRLLNTLDSSAAGSDSGKFTFVFKMRDVCKPYSQGLYYLEYDDNELSSHKVKKLNLNLPFDIYYSVVGSINGLICINGLPNHKAYICNPLTRECITLPELDRKMRYVRDGFKKIKKIMLSGFGFVASTNEYKVVRLYTFWEVSKSVNIEVYTVGSGKGWRNVGNINYTGSLHREHAVFVNGFLHWNFGEGKIMAFDLAKEVFVELDEYVKKGFWGGVLGGHFCGRLYSEDYKNCDVWLLKKNEDDSFVWSKEFSLIHTDKFTTSIALLSSGKVLCHSDTKLHLYDLKSMSSKMLEDFGRSFDNVSPHINTLVSLKAFGEESMETGIRGKCNRGRAWQMKQQ